MWKWAMFLEFSFKQYKGENIWKWRISYIGNEGTVVLIDMTEEVHKEILAVLNSGHWYNDVSKCESDYSFETKNEKIYYHADCGTFNDVTYKRYMTLSEEEKEKINQLLGVTMVCE